MTKTDKTTLIKSFGDIIQYLQEHISDIESNKLHNFETVLRQLNSIIYDANDTKWIGNDVVIDRVLTDERSKRGEWNYSDIALTNNSIGVYVLKRDMKFTNSGSLTGACKGCLVELSKKDNGKYEVRSISHPYAKLPKIEPAVRRTITEKQIKYYIGNKVNNE